MPIVEIDVTVLHKVGHICTYMDGIYLCRNGGRVFENVVILSEIEVNEDGYCEPLGTARGYERGQGQIGQFLPMAP